MKTQIPFLKRFEINDVIKFLTYSDIIALSGWGLVSPILAVFFTENIEGGNIAVAGIATTIYLASKSILQIPFAKLIDEGKGEVDDYKMLIASRAVSALAILLFIFARNPMHIYLIQILNGVGDAMMYPSWTAIFTRHIDKQKEGYEWSLYYTAVDIAGALAAGLGGFLVIHFGYNNVFILVAILTVISTLFLVGVRKSLKK